MEFASYVIPWKATNQPNGPITTIVPIGDIQYTGDDSAIAKQKLKDDIQRGLDENAWFISMADMTDFMSPGNRQRYVSARLYDTATSVIGGAAKRITDDLYTKYLTKTKGKWLGVLQGHHYFHYKEGYTSDQYLCQLLECPFLGDNAMIHLKYQDGKNHYGTVKIWAHHGYGSGSAVGSILRKLEKQAARWDAEIFLMGHLPYLETAPKERIYSVEHRGQFKLRCKPQLMVGTGGYSKSYQEHHKIDGIPSGGYAEKAGYSPVVLGSPTVRIQPRIMDQAVGGVRNRWFYPQLIGEVRC